MGKEIKVPYKIEHGTYINKERGFYPENNEPFEDVERPLVRLVANDIVIEENRATWGATEVPEYYISGLESTAHSVLNSNSIKQLRKNQKKFISRLKKDFETILKTFETTSAERERFALERLEALKSKKLKKWEAFKGNVDLSRIDHEIQKALGKK